MDKSDVTVGSIWDYRLSSLSIEVLEVDTDCGMVKVRVIRKGGSPYTTDLSIRFVLEAHTLRETISLTDNEVI